MTELRSTAVATIPIIDVPDDELTAEIARDSAARSCPAEHLAIPRLQVALYSLGPDRKHLYKNQEVRK